MGIVERGGAVHDFIGSRCQAFDFLPRPLTRGDARPAGSDSDRNCQPVKSVFSFFFFFAHPPCVVFVCLHEGEQRRRFLT